MSMLKESTMQQKKPEVSIIWAIYMNCSFWL